jgi:hypothetical protein
MVLVLGWRSLKRARFSMQTTPQFTWRPHSETGRGKKLPVFTFVLGIIIGQCWNLVGGSVPERSPDLAVVRADPTTAIGVDRITPALAPRSEVRPAPPIPEVAASEEPAAYKTRRPEHQRTASRTTSRGSRTIKRQRAALVRHKPKKESDYAALREFLLKQ